MRCLSVRPPWGWAVIWGGKSPENRTWATKYRGLVFVHQSLTNALLPTSSDSLNALNDAYRDRPDTAECATAWEAKGAIIGSVQLVDCHPEAGCCAPWGEASFTSAGGNLCTGVWHWVFEDARAIEPIPARGRQGLWKPDPDLAFELATALDLYTAETPSVSFA